jgi:hypothetical protein
MVRLNPEQRRELHTAATTSTEKGSLHKCRWFLFPKVEGPHEVPEKNIVAAQSMGTMMFENSGFAKLSLHIYKILYYKLRGFYNATEVAVMIKGSSALALYFSQMDDYRNSFPFSDIDLSVIVNPMHSNYDEVFKHVKVIVGQVFAKHKQYMDRVFFKTQRASDVTPPDFDIFEFIDTHIMMCENINMVSPFVDDDVRNACSYPSFSIVKHSVRDDVVVKINEPHFDNAEFIPLDKTPIFCSMNDTLDNIVLYRMKWNFMDTEAHHKSIDFIDCIIPRKDSTETQDFYNNGGFDNSGITIIINRYNTNITIPSLQVLCEDLRKCIYEYDCPESKREIREKRYKILQDYLKHCETVVESLSSCNSSESG